MSTARKTGRQHGGCKESDADMSNKSYVIISDAPNLDYIREFVVMPECYGTNDYYKRDDVKGIRYAVFRALDELNERTGFAETIRSKRVAVKPNMVGMGKRNASTGCPCPQNTDPRVIDAVMYYLCQFTDDIAIIGYSGVSAEQGFAAASYDRIAAHYGAELINLSGAPTVRRALPQARVLKSLNVPEPLDRELKAGTFFVSVPKLKDGLCPGLTFGLENALDAAPQFLRELGSARLAKKLADILYLIDPPLTIIDGIICCIDRAGAQAKSEQAEPAMIGKIICGNNGIEVDRIATYLMGLDPERNELIQEAVSRGFGSDMATVIGNMDVIKKRSEACSLLGD